MRKVISKILFGVVFAEVVGGLVLGFLVYFVRSFDKATGAYFDGLGRKLELSPFFARFIFGADSLWPGWGYFALDFVVFWGAVGLGYALVNLAAKIEAGQENA
jgi:hypothetical protein